jgi:hypothetical protein
MENYDRQQESVEQADANAGDVEHIEITLEEAAAMEKEHERLEMQRFAERALEREQLRAEELERDRVIDKAREVAMEPENVERYRWLQDMSRRAEEMQRPKEDAEERQEHLAKFADEWLKREQQQQERSQQPVEKTAEPEDLGEYVQSQYKWAKNFLRDNSPEDQKWLLENDSKYREAWLEGSPPDDPLAKEIRERFPMREEKHMDEPVNDLGAGDAVKTGVDENDIEMPPDDIGQAGAPGEEGVDHTDEPIIDSDKDVLEGYYRDVGDEEGADRAGEPVVDPVAKETVKTASGHDLDEEGADRADEPVNDLAVLDTFEDGFGYDPGEDDAGYMDDSGIDSGRVSFEGDPALSGFGEHAYEPLGDVGESFEDSSFDSAW